MAETQGFGPIIRMATPQGAVVAMQGCMTCGGVVAEEMATIHAEWHGAISGVAIEQWKLIGQLRGRLAEIDSAQMTQSD